MKKYRKNLILIVVTGMVTLFTSGFMNTSQNVYFLSHQSTCAVLLESISGSYEGDCKKGLAHGTGKSVGTDMYEGAFKKGLPHGKGTYTWSNGDFYTGEFKKGMKDGPGELLKRREDMDDLKLTGYWLDDEYIGASKYPYKVTEKSISISRVSFNKVNSEDKYIDFKFTRRGKPIISSDFNISGSFGVIESQTDYKKTVRVYDYPLKAIIRFQVPSPITRIEASTAPTDGYLEFEISQAGHWEVTIDIKEME